ncbi:elongator complex protein 1 [Caerostris extrusa]|uniref:Elongator complex protein 1 n=1 Tax=Caerostris extrusa TaxID=172846 RepID=A0AAV4WN38_CAEEX|nr:elongator complex protein 1 [Caerostris extrusa]
MALAGALRVFQLKRPGALPQKLNFLDKPWNNAAQLTDRSMQPDLTLLNQPEMKMCVQQCILLSFKDCVQHNSSTTSVNKINVIHDAFRKVLGTQEMILDIFMLYWLLINAALETYDLKLLCAMVDQNHKRIQKKALNLFPSSSPQRQAIWGEYGNYLMSKRYFDEAGMVFTRCEMHEKALLAYTEGVNWQMALYSANSLSYKGNKIAQLCQDLSAKLKSHQKYLDAAHLLEHYVQDSEEAIVTLVEGCEWNMAMMMISKYNRYDLEESHFIPALKEHHVNLKSHLEQLFKTFSQHSERLKIVRTQKKVKTEESNAITCADDELFSDIGSVTDAASSCAESKQSGSIMTRKSSKNRKKLKLKKYRLKEGSADEDLALIVALSEIATKIDTLKDNFLNTLKAMVHFEFDDAAKTLQELMMKIISVVETEMPIIWNPLENIGSTPDMKFGPDSTVNSITATLQSGNKASPTNIDPELAAPPWRKIELSLQMFN